MADEQSFWTTLPGILTAVGAIILAVATLVTAMHGAGFFSSGPDTKSPGDTADNVNSQEKVTEQPTVEPLSFSVIPKTVSRGQEVSLYFNTPAPPPSSMVYLNNRPLPKKVFSTHMVITIPSDESGTGLIKVTTQDGQTATQSITIVG